MPRGISRRVGPRQLPVTSYVVLGLVGQKPGAGYDLALFAARSIAHMWPITRSQIYAELPRLESLGLVVGSTVVQDRLPDKRTYALTELGREALREWFSDNLEEERFHSSLLAKLFFARHAPPAQAQQILAAFTTAARRRQERFQAIVDHLEGRPGSFFPRLTALYAVRRSEAEQAWAAEAQELVATHIRITKET